MSDLFYRLLIGGVVVSVFALLADVIRPKSFAGLFGAAPSIALATVGLTVHQHGNSYAAIEAWSMIVGAFAFLVYAAFVAWTLRRYSLSSLEVTISALPLWLIVAFSLSVLVGQGR